MRKIFGVASFLFGGWMFWQLCLWVENHQGTVLRPITFQEYCDAIFPFLCTILLWVIVIGWLRFYLVKWASPKKKAESSQSAGAPPNSALPKGSSKN